MSDIKIGRMVLGSCSTNTYFLYREDRKEAVLVDPADRGYYLDKSLKDNGFTVAGIILTHGHFDHMMGCRDVQKMNPGIKVYAPLKEKELMADPSLNLSVHWAESFSFTADEYIKDGDELEIAGIKFKMIETPGHTVGGCSYYVLEAGFLLCGDTLFLESVGRTDFETGSMSTLVRSVREKLFVLPDDTKCYPGHGEATSIGHEKMYNPFCGENI